MSDGSDPTDRGLAISDVSLLLGVPIPTLRSWEKRYAVPTIVRDTGSHRRYHHDQLHALRVMRDEISRGKRAAQAAATVRADLATSGPARGFINDFLAASAASDPVGLRNAIDDAYVRLGLGHSLDEVLMPAMRQVGLWWQTGRCEITDEQLATRVARAWLTELSALGAAPSGRPVLLACGPRDLHTIGLEALSALLRREGIATHLLGARVEPGQLSAATHAADAAGVVIVSHLATGRRGAAESIRLLHASGMPVYYAGNAFATPLSRRGIPGRYLGTKLDPAAQLIAQAHAAEQRKIQVSRALTVRPPE